MNIAVIVPFTRPQMLQNVRENFARQRYRNKTLVIVENGAGVGTFPVGLITTAVLVGESIVGKSAANNAGITEAANLGCEYFAIFDDDDWYGPWYLDEVARCSGKADATGIERYTYQDPDGERWVHADAREDCLIDEGALGGTLAGRTAGLPLFNPIQFCEEILWSRDIKRAGLSFYARQGTDFVHRRFSAPEHRHTFPQHLDTSDGMVKL